MDARQDDLFADMAEDATSDDEQTTDGAPAGVAALGQELSDLRDEIGVQDQILKDLKFRKNTISKELLPGAMKAAGLVGDNGKGSFTLGDGTKIHLRTNLYASYVKAKQVAFFAWLIENGHKDLIKETVNANTLKAFVREQREEGNDIPQDLVTVHDEVVAVAVKS